MHEVLQTSGATAELRSLLEATEASMQPGAASWQFGLHVPRLLEAGSLSPTTLRLLIAGGYLEQRIETTGENGRVRTFRGVKHLALEDRCRLLLTASGLALVRSVLEDTAAGELADDTVVSVEPVRPHWSAGPGVLYWQREVVRRVPHFALNLRLALDSQEEQRWPPQGVDNPFDPRKKGAAQRLLQTIAYLNQHQLDARIEFSIDRSHTKFRWRVPPAETPAATVGKVAALEVTNQER